MRQANADLRTPLRRDDVPRLALAVGHSHGARESVVRMDLDRQWLVREQQLEQQGRRRSPFVGPFEPKLSHGIISTVDATPRLKITDAPRLVNDAHRGLFGGHSLS